MTDRETAYLVWMRLFHGRLWHLPASSFTGSANQPATFTECGEEAQSAEILLGAPPLRGWVCERCVRILAERADLAARCWRQDPRRQPGDHLLTPQEA